MRPHVLVARQDNDGDVLLAGPAVRAIAAGAREVTLLCGPRGEQAARLLPEVDEVMVWRAPWIDQRVPLRTFDYTSYRKYYRNDHRRHSTGAGRVTP